MATPCDRFGDDQSDKRPVSSNAFGFPVSPYPLQLEFMSCIFDIIENGGIGIVESPTGTGKTLALLCPCVSWLRQRERAVLAESLMQKDDEIVEEWAQEHKLATSAAVANLQWLSRERHRESRRLRVKNVGLLGPDGKIQVQKQPKARRVEIPQTPVPSSYLDPMEMSPPKLPLPKLGGMVEFDPQALDDGFAEKLQIIFCSRTHSQLAQVLREIRRIPPESMPENVSVVTLGARANLCVNDSIRSRARGSGHLNDLCRIATERGEASGGCRLKKEAPIIADACLTEMLDIESMVERGKALIGGGCPYYGSRQAAREADILLVPYASLVNSQTRQKLGIKTKGSIMIFDEAHNLLEAIGDSNSVTLTATQACAASDELSLYAAQYEARLSPGNAMRLRQVRQFCTLLHQHLATIGKSCAHSVGGFLVAIGADHFDLADLSRFLEVTELPRKVRGFVEAMRSGASTSSGNTNAVYGVAELLGAFLGSAADDRILFQMPAVEGEVASVRYLSLNAEVRFRDIVTSARAVIFAGGTLEPRAEFGPLYTPTEAGVSVPRVCHFSGRHVVPNEQIFARHVTHGPHGHLLDFRRDSRRTQSQLAEVKAVVSMAAQSVPGGSIFFFPSFDYLQVVAVAVGSGIHGRQVFVESQKALTGNARLSFSNTESNDSLLRSYAAAVRRDGGAVLLAVSGAKLSEGMDFKDDLCRLVGVIGLPYPNSNDLALIEKMRFLDSRRGQGMPGISGREFYMSRCMKTVNQCIGRSIRHAKDWAAVLLLDHRYSHANIQNAISLWLREEAKVTSFKDAEPGLHAFFSSQVSTA